MIKTDIIIIGAGPVGLFTVFEAGLLKLKCHLIDSLPIPGGQCSVIYPKKPIYDIPGFPSILAGELIDNLMDQVEPFKPGFTLGEAAAQIEKQEDGTFVVTTIKGTKHKAPIIHSFPITTSSITTLFIPIKQFSPITPPCIIAPCPI